MLPFDDISNMHEETENSKANAALDGRLTDVPVESNLGSEPVQNVSGFMQDFVQDMQGQEGEVGQSSAMNGTLQAINASLGSILGVQNEQLFALRNLPIGASAERINSLSSNTETNVSTTNSNESNLSQVSNFVNELQSLESTIKTVNTNVAISNANSSTQNSSNARNNSNAQNNANSQNTTNLSVENEFEAATEDAGGSEFGQTFSLLNPRDREFLSYVSNFSNAQSGNTNVTNGGPTSNQTLSVNNNALNNTLQEIRDGDMTIDRTEIQNRVNQTAEGNSSETNVHNSNLFSAFSTALAQHDQTLVQTITNVNNATSPGQDKSVQLTSFPNETTATRDVQKGNQTVVASNNDVLAMLSQISMQLMHLNATMGSALRKTSFI